MTSFNWSFNHTHTHPFNGPLSGTTQVGRYEKGKTNLYFTEARDSEWQWHQLGHMQVCTSLQTDNHTSAPPLSFLQAGCPPAARPNQQRQSTEGKVLQPDTGSSARILGGLYGGSYVGLTVGCSSTRLSVCLSRRSTAATAAGGFAAEHPEGRRYRSIAAGCNEEWIVPHAYFSDAFTYNLG